MSNDPKADAALIERDIDRTQDKMGDTVQRLEDKLRPPQLAAAVIGDNGSVAAKQALEVAKRNPIAVALIAAGAIWLVASRGSRDAIRRMVSGSTSRSAQHGQRASRTNPRKRR